MSQDGFNRFWSRRDHLRAFAFALGLGSIPASTLAQSAAYPSRPIKLVIPYPPGGGTDITGRAMAQRMSEALGQSVIIENKPGATGMIGAAVVAKGMPDGYTVLFGAASEMAINASLFRNMTYDPRADFEPVSLVAVFPLVFVAPTSSNQSLRELIDAAGRKPASVSYGSIGSGSPQHLAAELLSSMAKVKLLHVPYKGSGPLVQDAVGGHLDMAVSSVPPAVPLVKSGKLRALAVTSAVRSEALPDVPTMAELGYPGYEFNTWVGMAVPKGTPNDVIARLHQSLIAALQASDVQAALRDQGAVPVGSTPAAFREYVQAEIAKSDRIVADAGIQPE
ncbi:Tripartite-type tricarboxylate transporter, receptor component TctC [Enhydrobacter aerosaccus]|uniref:Tripartite-type tricarboxylate transporter, receptor component TctC n=1 Tax=Enhydrobacter aerosaccus TaxID=225324 RepID=A0A1T4LJ80_9HYPH|nr:tripartite tricarboxylate transporter substrate binding protein [Enhydrobacter aerosaccus]SJZ54676.1 Tripartite-type tricarboxylate transporter, receptor component TctC [Enhydrobacter aerosaccus]